MARVHLLKMAVVAILTIACSSEKKQRSVSTAQPNVVVPERQFRMSGLERDRQIRIYLPPHYQNTQGRYPVLYMHDAQNLFDDSTSYAGEWGIDESLNELSQSMDLNIIVVGIDNGQDKRMNELSPWENQKFGKAEGAEYIEFIVKQVKPFIDSTYRTLSDRENTAIIGSSMGGLISHYAIYKYQDVFSKAGIFSASYWYSDEVYSFTKDNPVPSDSRLYLIVGKNEGAMVDESEKMYDQIVAQEHPKENVMLVVDADGEHNEASWRRQFTPAIKWLFNQKK
ncbi:hypothetical protein BH09BAC3_BH09BAC3_13930 [soil metagenome]